MTFNAIAIDDERYALLDFLEVVRPIAILDVVASFSSISDAIPFLNKQRHVNFIFTDIEMPGISGIDGGSVLASYCDTLVFTTGHPKYALEAFGVGGKAYLMKPVQRRKVLKLLDDLVKVKSSRVHEPDSIPQFLEVKTLYNRESYSLALNDVLSITTCGNYVELQTSTQRFIYQASLLAMRKMLADNRQFIPLNQSCMVARNAISRVRNHVVWLSNGEEHKVSRAHRGLLYLYVDEN